jgi:hypothetical protein
MARDPHVHQRLIDLAKNLLQRTQEGGVSWTATDNETAFLFSGTNSSVQINSYTDRDGDMHTVLSILNSRGTVVDSIEDEFRPAPIDGYEPEDWNEVLDDLYYAARRNALDVDSTLDDLLADLEDENGTRRAAAKEQKTDPWSDEPPF